MIALFNRRKAVILTEALPGAVGSEAERCCESHREEDAKESEDVHDEKRVIEKGLSMNRRIFEGGSRCGRFAEPSVAACSSLVAPVECNDWLCGANRLSEAFFFHFDFHLYLV